MVKDSLTRGIRNNNPLNIRINPRNNWLRKEKPSRDPEFETWADKDVVYGIRAGAVLIMSHYDRRGVDTIAKLIKTWAPPKGDRDGDGVVDYTQNTKEYIAYVADYVGIPSSRVVNFHDYKILKPTIEAMIRFENAGRMPYTQAQIDKALALAGVEPPAPSLAGSRTMQAQTVAGAAGGAAVVTGALSDYLPLLSDVAAFLREHQKLGLILIGAVILATVIATVYARWDDRRRGLR